MPDTFITWSAPGRCGIVGNPSDMYGGSVISCSTAERAYVTVEDSDVMEFDVAGQIYTVRSPEDLRQNGGMFDAILAAIEYFGLEGATLKITSRSAIPVRAGLSGSTAVITALVAALLEWIDGTHKGSLLPYSDLWRQASRNRHMLAETVRHLELYFLRIVCGYQDAYMCVHGSLNFLDFHDKENYLSLKREPLGTVEDLCEQIETVPFVLAHTGIQRVSGAVHKPVRDRWIEGDTDVVEGMLRLGHIARMSKRAMVTGDWEYLAESMTENHEIISSLGSSSEINESIIRVALDNGALAAKLAGAGKGGTVIALHPEPHSLEEAFRDAGVETILYPEPADGVRREDIHALKA